MENQNTHEYLEAIRNRLLENLSKLPPVPSVPFHHVPPDSNVGEDTKIEEDGKEDPDER